MPPRKCWIFLFPQFSCPGKWFWSWKVLVIGVIVLKGPFNFSLCKIIFVTSSCSCRVHVHAFAYFSLLKSISNFRSFGFSVLFQEMIIFHCFLALIGKHLLQKSICLQFGCYLHSCFFELVVTHQIITSL